MEGLSLIVIGVLMFIIIVLLLVAVILVAKSKLVASGNVNIMINEDVDKKLTVPIGGKLLNVLASQNIFLPSEASNRLYLFAQYDEYLIFFSL